MKKSKLQLRRTTLKPLQSDSLAGVAGGGPATGSNRGVGGCVITDTCNTYCVCPTWNCSNVCTAAGCGA